MAHNKSSCGKESEDAKEIALVNRVLNLSFNGFTKQKNADERTMRNNRQVNELTIISSTQHFGKAQLRDAVSQGIPIRQHLSVSIRAICGKN